MSVSLQIRKQIDRAAKGAELQQATFATGTSFWTLVDAAGDQTYENRVKGTDMTALDLGLAGASQLGTAFRTWFDKHLAYFTTDLSLSSSGVWDTYLSTVAGIRVPAAFAQMLVDSLGENYRPDPQNVFAKGTYAASGALSAAGLHRFGRLTGGASDPTYTSADGALDATVCMGPVLCHTVDATPGPSSLVMTLTRVDGTTVDLTVTPNTSANGQAIVGEEAITGVAGAVISCAATGQFKVGEYVLLYENAEGDTALREIGLVESIVANTSITLASAPVNTFTSSGKIQPVFKNVAWKSGTITEAKNLDFYSKPDRIIAL